MVKDRAINTLHIRGAVLGHPLETLAEEFPPERDACQERQEVKVDETWSKLNLHARQVALAHIEFYLENFIRFIQVGPVEKT